MSKLLIVADLENQCVATPRGLELAYRMNLKVEVVSFVFAPLRRMGLKSRKEQEEAKKKLLAKREAEVQARIDKYAKPGQQVKLKMIWRSRIHDWVINRVKKGFTAVVKTTHRSGSFHYTSTDWHLLRECPVPVMIVADRKWAKTKPILAAVDLNSDDPTKRALNDKVIEMAKQFADTLELELKLICAIPISPVLLELDLIDPIAHTRQAREAMKPYVEELSRRHDIPMDVFRTKRGPTPKVITSEAARLRAQLVVMGSVGRTGMKARLLGNTAEATLRHLNTDVLALRADA